MTEYIRVGGGKDRRLLHSVIAERALGRRLQGTEQVHHFDLNPLNNQKENLVICPDKKYHELLHTRMEAFLASGNPAYRKCYLCKTWCDTALMTQTQRSSTSVRPSSGNYYYHKACALANYHAKKERLNTIRNARRRKDYSILNADRLLDEI